MSKVWTPPLWSRWFASVKVRPFDLPEGSSPFHDAPYQDSLVGMRSFSGLLSLALLAACASQPVRGQVFFPVGLDHLTYDPRVPGTPAGRIYIGDLLRQGNCHFRLDLPPGKPIKQIEFVKFVLGGDVIRGVAVTSGEGHQTFYENSEFELVDKDGNPCRSTLLREGEFKATAAGAGGLKIPVSNDADSFAVTCNGRFAVVVGANSATPISLVDFATKQEVDALAADSNATWVSSFDDGESVVVVQNIPPRNVTNRLRRLRVVEGKFVDTGESLEAQPGGDFPDYRFKKVFPVAGSKVGVAIAEFGNPQLVTFSIPGLKVLDSLDGAGGHSGAVNCRGDKIYVRVGSQIRGYTVDPVTGTLGRTPFLSIRDVGETDTFASNFGNAVSISGDGTRLIVSEGTAFPGSPPTPRTTFFDTASGDRQGLFDVPAGGSPTLVATPPCCSEAEPRLSIQRLASGRIQINSTGNVGENYELQESPNLVGWSKLLEFQMTDSPAAHVDPDPATNAIRYYRLKRVP